MAVKYDGEGEGGGKEKGRADITGLNCIFAGLIGAWVFIGGGDGYKLS